MKNDNELLNEFKMIITEISSKVAKDVTLEVMQSMVLKNLKTEIDNLRIQREKNEKLKEEIYIMYSYLQQRAKILFETEQKIVDNMNKTLQQTDNNKLDYIIKNQNKLESNLDILLSSVNRLTIIINNLTRDMKNYDKK